MMWVDYLFLTLTAALSVAVLTMELLNALVKTDESADKMISGAKGAGGYFAIRLSSCRRRYLPFFH